PGAPLHGRFRTTPKSLPADSSLARRPRARNRHGTCRARVPAGSPGPACGVIRLSSRPHSHLAWLDADRAVPCCSRHEASMLSRLANAFGLEIGALVLGLVGLTGCGTGGGSAGAATLSCAGGAPNALCLMNCSLGCSSTGCQVTDIAQNEIITWEFNKDVD